MKKRIFLVILTLTFVLSINSILGAGFDNPQVNKFDTLTPLQKFSSVSIKAHDPISINGTIEFVNQAKAEEWQGNGTVGAPYIITGFHIVGSGEGIPRDPYNPPPINYSSLTRFLININNTSLHFQISSCVLIGAETYGIYLYNVTNANILTNNVTQSNGDGIRLEKCLNSTVKDNLVFSNSLRGIDLRKTNSSVISNNSVYSNGVNGIYLGGSWNNNVSTNVAHDNLWHGISLEFSANYNSVLKNTVYRNSKVGVGFWSASNYNILNNNYIYKNEESGILFTRSDHNVVLFNTIYSNNEGFSCNETVNNTINHNEIGYNNHSGLFFDGSKDMILFNNSVFENADGLFMYLTWNVSIFFNHIFLNRYNGIVIEVAEYNTIHNNYIADNGENGVFINDRAVYNVIVNNTIFNNGGYGIWTESLENTIAGNKFSENGAGTTNQDLNFFSQEVITAQMETPQMVSSNILLLVIIGGFLAVFLILIVLSSRKTPSYSWKSSSEVHFSKKLSVGEVIPKYCSKCGAPIDPKDIFCNSCGNLLA